VVCSYNKSDGTLVWFLSYTLAHVYATLEPYPLSSCKERKLIFLCAVACVVASPFVVTDVDGCAEAGINPCKKVADSNGTCIDQKAPNTGFTCACNAGRAWNGSACAGKLATSW
jgi:hypothetical protein